MKIKIIVQRQSMQDANKMKIVFQIPFVVMEDPDNVMYVEHYLQHVH